MGGWAKKNFAPRIALEQFENNFSNAIIFVSKMIVKVKKGQIFMALLVTCTFPKAQERKLVYQCTLSYSKKLQKALLK